MKNNTKIIIGVGAGVLLLLLLRNRNRSQSENILKGGEYQGDESLEQESTSGGGGGGGAIGGSGSLGGTIGGIFGGGSGGVAPSPIVINNPTINTLRPMPIAQSQVSPRPYTSSVNLRPATSPIDLRPATSANTNQASATTSRANFLTFDGSFRSPSNLDFDGGIID